MKSSKKLVSWVLVFSLLFSPINGMDFSGSAPVAQANAESKTSTGVASNVSSISLPKAGGNIVSPFGSGSVTWAQGAKSLCRLLGYLSEDAGNIDLTKHKGRITGLSMADDSLYLALLAEYGYLESISEPIDPNAKMPRAEYEKLLSSAFRDVVTAQEDADRFTVTSDLKNLAVTGGPVQLSALGADRILIGKAGRVSVTGTKATALSVAGDAKVYLKATELERLTIGTVGGKKAGKPTVYLHVDSETKLPEIVIDGAGDVTIEGNGALGTVRVLGDTGTVTVRATCSVINETQRDVTVVGPDGQPQTLKPAAQTELVLNYYLVSFVTDGTPVESKLLAPGESLDFGSITTARKGYVFTAWYEDAGYTMPRSSVTAVDGELTLYARFIQKKDAVTVNFETFGGQALAPLVFAKGENLLCKPVSLLYTWKEGYTFGGWCTDKECTQPFGYTEPIGQSMTLYALFTSNEPVKEEKESSVAQLENIDWQAEIPLTVPKGMSLGKLKSLVTVEAGTGISVPQLSFRKSKDGYAVYGKYYKKDGMTGFEPGSSFTITVSGGVRFFGYGDAVNAMAVSVYREETEIVEFNKELTYVLWDQVLSYEPVEESTNAKGEKITLPGTITLADTAAPIKKGQIVVFYDGEINRNEKNISSWKKGGLDGYVLFADIDACVTEDGRMTVFFKHANPQDYLLELDVHVKEDANLEDALDKEQIGRIEKEITSQVIDNDELKAQMLVAVMTTPAAQARLDEMYGKGVYQLSGISATFKANKPSVKLSVSGSTVTVGITISAVISLKNGEDVILTITPSLTFEQKVTLTTNVDAGTIWIDASATILSVSTIRLEITANSGEKSDLNVLNDAKETLEQLITPDGIDDSIDYKETVDKLMKTMQSLISTSLPYNDLFVVPLFSITITFYGIVSLEVNLDLVGQIGVLATFGIEIIVTNGQKIGFRYNFLKASGGSYKEKLANDVRTNIYLIGKIGARLGLRLTIKVTLCGVAYVSITGEIFAYAELTGMLFYTASLLTGSSTYVGALYFEVGLDASVSLTLGVDLLLISFSKSWTLWNERWPLYSKSLSSSLSIMDINKLDEMWRLAVENADHKTVFGFANIPMLNYELISGNCRNTELLWDQVQSGVTMTLSIENMVIDGIPIESTDPRSRILTVGDGSNGRSRGQVYLDESVAAAYRLQHADCDVVLTYENTNASALVKKQSHTFHLSRSCVLSTTTVNVQIKLYDWCAHAWGIESAPWDNSLLYNTSFETSHVVGGLFAPTATGQLDLNVIKQSAVSLYPELAAFPISWNDRTVNGTDERTVQYSVPRISNFCYLTPENGLVRYDVHPETHEQTLTWYLYASRFPGYRGEINYIVKMQKAYKAVYDFSVSGSEKAEPMHFTPDPAASDTWNLTALRSAFDGTARPVMVSADGAIATETGLTISGREPEETVTLVVEQKPQPLSIVQGEGIGGYTVVSPEIAQDKLVTPGTQVVLSIVLEDNYRNPELISEPAGLYFTQSGNEITFTMPAYPISVTLIAYPVNRIDYQYNYGGMGLYKSVFAAANEKVIQPTKPFVEGLTFRGWYETPECQGEPYVFGGNALDNLTLYADWTCDVTINFGSVAGQAAYAGEDGLPVLIFENDYTEYYRFTYSTLKVGSKLLDVLLPNYSGYDFLGWYLTPDFSGEPVDLETYTLTGGVTLNARWSKVISIRYDWNYREQGTYIEALEHSGLPMASVPEDPVLDWHNFTGWYTNPACIPESKFDPAADLPQEDMVLYAGWEADIFTISYDLAGGDNNSQNPQTYTVDSGSITLLEPTRAGYSFAGWTGTELTEPALSVTIPFDSHIDRSYTATWSLITYSITYDLVRGTLSSANPAEYTIESPPITLNNPTKDRYEFAGWTGTGLTEPAMTVIIPTGSFGNRSYMGTWTTDDPASLIADNALDSIESRYDYTVDTYVDGTGEGSSLYESILASIAGSSAGAYTGDMTVSLVKTTDAPAESPEGYTYGFAVTVIYTDDTGTAFDRSKFVLAFAAKRQPSIESLPTPGDLTHGQSLAYSSLTGGSAKYSETSVDGVFTWVNLSVIPLGKDNGNAIYQAVFTPNDTSLYTSVNVLLAVNTQTLVVVSVTADDRDYIKDDTTATGSYTLKDADTDETLTGITLSGAAYHFSQYQPGNGLTVTCSGYSLSVPSGQEGYYILSNTTATAAAAIHWITPETVAPTASGSYCYHDLLNKYDLTGGSATYNSGPVAGAWAWESPSTRIENVGELPFSATFTPTDTEGYRSVTVSLPVTVQKKAVSYPIISGKTYNSSLQTAEVSDTSDYTVTQNNGGINAGIYPVKLTLRNTDYYRWSDDAVTGAEATLDFVISKAALTVTLGGGFDVQDLGYGQRLTSGADSLPRDRSASTMISGVEVTYNGGASVAGYWTWDVSGLTQPMSVGDHTVSASFTPTSLDPGNFEAAVQSFTVRVAQAVPDVSGVILTASSIYQSDPAQNDLTGCRISAAGSAVNPNDSSITVSGTWSFDDPSRVPEVADSEQSVTFTPSSSSYTTAASTVTVPFRNYVIVTIQQNDTYLLGGRLCYADDLTYTCFDKLIVNVTPGTPAIPFTPWLAAYVDDFAHTTQPVYMSYLILNGRLGGVSKSVQVYFNTDSQPTEYSPEGIISISNNGGIRTITFSEGNTPSSDMNISVSIIISPFSI